MFSLLRKGLIYKNISSDVVEHDLDVDADQWSYDGRDVYRGSVDQEYINESLSVYWLYDDNSKRVGLAEHESEDLAQFKCLWFYDNPFATLFQDTKWKSTGKTVISMLSSEAYQDCLEADFELLCDQCLTSNVLLVTPDMLMKNHKLYTCEKCGKKTLTETNVCSSALVSDIVFTDFSVLFIDEFYVIYEKSTQDQPQPDASEPEQLVEQAQSVDLLESLDVLHPTETPSQPPEEVHPHLHS
jgi:hypothetical protein